MQPDLLGEGETDLAEEMSYPCALGCDEQPPEDYPVALGLDMDDPAEWIH